jgi:hypothetical protein
VVGQHRFALDKGGHTLLISKVDAGFEVRLDLQTDDSEPRLYGVFFLSLDGTDAGAATATTAEGSAPAGAVSKPASPPLFRDPVFILVPGHYLWGSGLVPGGHGADGRGVAQFEQTLPIVGEFNPDELSGFGKNAGEWFFRSFADLTDVNAKVLWRDWVKQLQRESNR